VSSPERRPTLITLFRATAQQMVDELIARLNAAGHPGMRSAYSQVMENIDRDGTRVTELAARARISHPSMIELVAAMERLGYIERLADPTDARARLVRLTQAGRALQRQALHEVAEIEREWLDRLNDAEGSTLREAMASLLAQHRPQLDPATSPTTTRPASSSR
jgi:DNA-binding MarR family transcriptional regulator